MEASSCRRVRICSSFTALRVKSGTRPPPPTWRNGYLRSGTSSHIQCAIHTLTRSVPFCCWQLQVMPLALSQVGIVCTECKRATAATNRQKHSVIREENGKRARKIKFQDGSTTTNMLIRFRVCALFKHGSCAKSCRRAQKGQCQQQILQMISGVRKGVWQTFGVVSSTPPPRPEHLVLMAVFACRSYLGTHQKKICHV